MKYQAILLVTVFLVYSLKAFRFYFLLVGEGVSALKYLRLFAITTLVNIVIPFKAGEIFRIFRFGHLTKSYIKGVSIVLLDRFVDTISILLIFATMNFLGNYRLGRIFFLLAAVSMFIALCFFIMPGMMEFWNEYFIKTRPSNRHLRGLFLIKKIKTIYVEIRNLVKGRFFVLFTLSVFSWLLEIGSLFLCRNFFDSDSDTLVSDYLSVALTGKEFEPQRNFVMAGVVFLSSVYVIIILIQLVKKLEHKNGR